MIKQIETLIRKTTILFLLTAIFTTTQFSIITEESSVSVCSDEIPIFDSPVRTD